MATKVFDEVDRHYSDGFDETDARRTGRGRIGSISFDEADELFRSWIDEKKWPYQALLFDPRVFTFIFEKTARLLGNQLRGHLIPREGGDVVGAKINNEILKFQWDQARHGGSMLSKWSLMDINTRKYGSSFALCKWRYEQDQKGNSVFDGPEMTILNNRDCAHDLAANSIEDANWFQVREYVTLQDLKNVNDAARGKPVYKNLDKLEARVKSEGDEDSIRAGDSRDVNWISRNRSISGLTNSPVGYDSTFRHIETTTEYRRDRWITFAQKYGLILRDIPNPYGTYEIPITMLRYYPIDDDLYGLSEIEPIKSLQKAINALLCQYVDEINQKLYSPIAIGPGVRQHTLKWGKGARWVMNNPMTDFRLVESNSNAAQFFNNTYSALVASMLNALGESSLGVSNIDRFNTEKTATEVKQLTEQRNARDNYNQIFLAEAIEKQMKLWYAMNQKMMFSDPDKRSFVVRIVGKDAMRYFMDIGLDKYGLTDDAEKVLEEKLQEAKAENPNVDVEVLRQALTEELETPIEPVEIQRGDETKVVSKLSIEDQRDSGELHVQPSDLMGDYDFIADVRSMSISSDDNMKSARNKAVTAILSNPNVIALLQQEKVRPKFKELFVSWLEDSGFRDAERFFESLPETEAPLPGGVPGQGAVPAPPGIPPPQESPPPAELVPRSPDRFTDLIAKAQGGLNGQPTGQPGIPA